MASKKSIDELFEEELPEGEDYEVEYEWVSMGRSPGWRERFVLLSFSSSLDDMYEDPSPPTMLDGSSDSAVYYCREERDSSEDDWEQVENQYGEIWQIHNRRP